MKPSSFNLNIHGLRGLCALAVMVHHIWNGPRDNHWFSINGEPVLQALNFFFDSLQFAVDVFFMISGYVIIGSLIKSQSVLQFFGNRLLRIYPLYLTILVLIFSAGPFVNYRFTPASLLPWLIALARNSILIPGLFPPEPALIVAWSLSFEFSFYLIAALTWWFYSRERRKSALLTLVILSICLCWLLPRSIFFSAGIAVYFLEQSRIPFRKWIVSTPALLWLVAMLILLEISALNGASLQLPMLVALAAGFLFFACITLRGASFLRSRWAQFYGTISYGFYMWHVVVMFGAKKLIESKLSSYPVSLRILILGIITLAVSTLLATVSFRLIEQTLSQRIRLWVTQRTHAETM